MKKPQSELELLRCRKANAMRHYGAADPRTIEIGRALLLARLAAAEAEADRLRREVVASLLPETPA